MSKKPNIILIMTDDQGYGDLSCMGATDFVTPNFDRLAAGGARLSSFYSNCPVCSPSRASLLTGLYPAHAGVRSILAGSRKTTGLTSQTPTLAQACKELNYSTAMVGKWHLGLAPESRPTSNGFDSFFGFMAGCIDYYSHIFYWGLSDGKTNPTHDLWKDNCEIHENGKYFTEMVTEKAVDYIHGQSDQDEPFMLFVSYNAPHYPMHAPEKYMKRFAHLPWDRQVMAAMLSCVDDGVGAIMDELERDGIAGNTCVFFQSDNGPSRESRNWLDGRNDLYYGGQAGVFKGHKFSLFEGGIRVPSIIRWPDVIPAGQVIDEPCVSMDIFPTLLKAIGGSPEHYSLDGTDILGMLSRGEKTPHQDIFWEMGPQTAVRRGKYKLVLEGQLTEDQPPQDPVFLSDLEKDPGETVNLADTMPELVQSMRQAALDWRKEIEKDWEKNLASSMSNVF